MPTFDFRCRKCNHVFEFARPYGSAAKPTCPECKSRSTEKLLSTPAIVFKGTGFYRTDSGKKDAPKQEATKPAAEKKETAKTEAKKEPPKS